MKKKFLALVMTLSMVLSLVPMTALATEGNTASATQEGQSVAADAIGNSTEGNAATSGSPGEDPNPDGNDIGDSGKSDGDAGNENTSGNDADSSTNPDASGGNDASEGEAGSEGEGSGETGNEGDSGDSNIEYPKETCTVDYSKTQSPFVTLSEVTGTWKDKNSVYEVTYTIAEGAPKDLVIDFTQAYELCVKKYRADSRWYFGPGDSIKVKIKIVNNSSNDYIYKNNSFVSAPQDTTLFGSIEEKNVYPALTYDGQLMPIALSTALLPDYFYDGLFEKERASKVSFEEMCQLYEKLEEKGYTGENALSDYLISHYNEKFGANYRTIEEMCNEHPDWILNGGTGNPYTSASPLSSQELKMYQEKYPKIAPFFNIAPSRNQEDSWFVNIKWPETKLAVLSYNTYYEQFLSVVFGEENVQKLNPNLSSGDTAFSRSHAVGDYLPDTELYENTNLYFQSLTESGLGKNDELLIDMAWGQDGAMSNGFELYTGTFYSIIELEEKPLPDPIGPGDANAHAKSKTATSLVKQSDGTYNSEVTLTFPAQAVQERSEIQVAETDKEYLPAYMIEAGSKVVDEIGGNEKGDYKDDKGNAYNFNFVNKADSIKMTVAGESYNAALAETPETGDTATYYFGTKDEGEETYPYVLHYYQNGTTFEDKEFGECFVWDINRDITCSDMVSLTYTVNLTNPQTSSGTYGNLDTNNCAILYPANRGTPEYYEQPKVSYTVSRGGHRPSNPTVTIPDDVPTGLDLKNHYGYIIGYPVDYYTGKPTTDQTKKPVRPEGKITRAEVATIYFRMLTDENRAANWNQVSGFSDVKSSAWYNNAISTLTKAGILKGYEDGTFQPNGYITRAEFATIAIRFFSGVYEGEDLFPDIKGHWAEDYINNAANKGLVKGYEDGTFGPDRYITRAEAVTLVNRTLNRHPHNDGLHKDMLVWPDNMDTSKWYYADMQEATNSHEPDKNKSTADKEYWGKMLPIRDWEALEKEWSNANSAPGEGEVV